jgi:hypothetical protein
VVVRCEKENPVGLKINDHTPDHFAIADVNKIRRRAGQRLGTVP